MPHTIGDLAAKLESLLKLRTIPFGMKLFERRADMEAIPEFADPKPSTLWTRWLPRQRGSAGPSELPQRIWSGPNAARS